MGKRNLVNSFLVAILLSQASCGWKGHGGLSGSIYESKKRKVFISEYNVSPNPYLINDTLKMKILYAWVEHKWGYGNFENETIILKDSYQLVIEVEPDIMKNYGVSWRIGVDGDRYLRSCGSNCLISDFIQLPKDIEEWEVQNGFELDSLSEKTIIGRFKIYKKKD